MVVRKKKELWERFLLLFRLQIVVIFIISFMGIENYYYKNSLRWFKSKQKSKLISEFDLRIVKYNKNFRRYFLDPQNSSNFEKL